MDREYLKDSLSGLYAYDSGCVSSGIFDVKLNNRCFDYIDSLEENESRVLLSEIMYELYLSPDALEQGYGWEDATQFGKWLMGE